MSKRRTYPSDGPESAAPQRPQRGEEQAVTPSASASADHQPEAEEMTQQEVHDASTQEERGASEALMESYNG
ncbi:MAG: hypothetical protein ACE5M4_00250 [Anaerolineales bacterium]